MIGHENVVKKQKRDKQNRKRTNAKHCDINNVYYRRLKNAMIACGHTRKYKRRRMIDTYINLNAAKCWIKMKGYSTFAEYRKKCKESNQWYITKNPKKCDEYRCLFYKETMNDSKRPKPSPKLINGEYMVPLEKGFEICTF